MDPAERELPASGEALFIDPESELMVPASVADVRAAYRNTVEEVIGEWRTMFGALGIGYEVISTDAPLSRRATAWRERSTVAPYVTIVRSVPSWTTSPEPSGIT